MAPSLWQPGKPQCRRRNTLPGQSLGSSEPRETFLHVRRQGRGRRLGSSGKHLIGSRLAVSTHGCWRGLLLTRICAASVQVEK